ncbi:uncharacterized protein N7496_004845 [Penicillium cataractarum]|uniref:Uncharacterized protein n=1 Tax=Penicillium cataractarum TaxID=2100454 RepID=A0A9W9SF11_9EURO|nr:uncharacterized protein N7496_004845 [Penicillium cataractarum]KAJ5377436.1 hypothetical protein N7496_004845 [Penicillium cataractarum]
MPNFMFLWPQGLEGMTIKTTRGKATTVPRAVARESHKKVGYLVPGLRHPAPSSIQIGVMKESSANYSKLNKENPRPGGRKTRDATEMWSAP